MLILERKIEEGIIINGNIIVKVLGIRSSKIKLGIEAPDNISIVRKELIDASRQNNPKDIS